MPEPIPRVRASSVPSCRTEGGAFYALIASFARSAEALAGRFIAGELSPSSDTPCAPVRWDTTVQPHVEGAIA